MEYTHIWPFGYVYAHENQLYKQVKTSFGNNSGTPQAIRTKVKSKGVPFARRVFVRVLGA